MNQSVEIPTKKEPKNFAYVNNNSLKSLIAKTHAIAPKTPIGANFIT